jgi:hypothetical protein
MIDLFMLGISLEQLRSAVEMMSRSLMQSGEGLLRLVVRKVRLSYYPSLSQSTKIPVYERAYNIVDKLINSLHIPGDHGACLEILGHKEIYPQSTIFRGYDPGILLGEITRESLHSHQRSGTYILFMQSSNPT